MVLPGAGSRGPPARRRGTQRRITLLGENPNVTHGSIGRREYRKLLKKNRKYGQSRGG